MVVHTRENQKEDDLSPHCNKLQIRQNDDTQEQASFHELASCLSIDLEVLKRRERVVGAGIKAPGDRPEG